MRREPGRSGFARSGVIMSHISAAEYLAEMRRLEAIRNEALRHHDRAAIAAVQLRFKAVNRVYWGRVPKGT